MGNVIEKFLWVSNDFSYVKHSSSEFALLEFNVISLHFLKVFCKSIGYRDKGIFVIKFYFL